MKNGIPYHPTFIAELEADHRVLLLMYKEIKTSLEANDIEAFQAALARFKSFLVAHLLKEAVRLYVYLKQKLKSDQISHTLVVHYKSEMEGIGKRAIDYADRFAKLDKESLDQETAKSELADLGRIIGDRIRREESELYPLYHDSY